MRPLATASATAAALLFAVTACAGSPAAPAKGAAGTRPSSGQPAAPPNAVARRCGPPSAPGHLTTIRADDGVRLSAVTAGAGPRGVVLVPELGPAGKCGWWPFAARLAANGYQVMLFDHRCTGESGCPSGAGGAGLMSDIRGAVSWLHRHGAAKIALMGASQGGSEVLIAATRPQREVTGVAMLSADELTQRLARRPYPGTATAAAPRLHLPALFAVAPVDPYVTVDQTRQLFTLARSRSKHLDIVPARGEHGWDFVTPAVPGGAPPAFDRTVIAFLRSVTS
jgi:dienelactone hydrolase